MNHLIGSSMTRAGVTQTRTFVYNNAGQLTSATNPENGTVTYTYSADTTLWGKQDAKGQLTVYGYDASKRITSVHVYPSGGSYPEDPCQLVSYGYDAGTYGLGRLTSTAYGGPNPGYTWGASGCAGAGTPWHSYSEAYSYHPAGAVTNKTLNVYSTYPSSYWTYGASFGVSYTYDSAGRLSTTAYPQTTYVAPTTYTYSYDGMGRAVSMNDNTYGFSGSGVPWVQNGLYDAAGRMTGMTRFNGATLSSDPSGWSNAISQTMGYNVNGQLTSLNWGLLPPYTGYWVWGIRGRAARVWCTRTTS
jgi:YD repeat-containing protein